MNLIYYAIKKNNEENEKEKILDIINKTEARLKNLENSLIFYDTNKKRYENYSHYLKGSAILCFYFEEYLKEKEKSLFEGYCVSNHLLNESEFNRLELEIIKDYIIDFSKSNKDANKN
ncbi:hypothetical protein GYA25_03505 [Candidatus Woesearchaeota archaeon]|nr:hypothetical protein [Candidatus Woesearchaeota archaeon]